MLVPEGKTLEIFKHLGLTSENTAIYDELTSSNPIDLGSNISMSIPAGYRFIRVDNRISSELFELALVSDTDKYVAYYNKIDLRDDLYLGRHRVTQVLIWRTSIPKYDNAIRGLPAAVFFEYLLRNYTVIVSDNEQTGNGMRFWQSRIYEALDLNSYIYRYHLLDCHLEPIKNSDDLERMQNVIWGSDVDHVNQLVVLSSIPLPVESVNELPA